MTTNHSEFITSALGRSVPFGWQSEVERVAAAYAGRDQEIANSLFEAGRRLGARPESLNRALTEAGLPEYREPQPEPVQAQVPDGDDDLRASVDELKRQVGELLSLANSRLGTNLS